MLEGTLELGFRGRFLGFFACLPHLHSLWFHLPFPLSGLEVPGEGKWRKNRPE